MGKQESGKTSEYSFTTKQGIIRIVYAFSPSDDFYNSDAILMKSDGMIPGDRVPINEDFWREIGKTFGYKFRKPKEKEEK